MKTLRHITALDYVLIVACLVCMAMIIGAMVQMAQIRTTEDQIIESARYCVAKMSPEEVRAVVRECVAHEEKPKEEGALAALIDVFAGLVCKEVGDAATY